MPRKMSEGRSMNSTRALFSLAHSECLVLGAVAGERIDEVRTGSVSV